MLIGIVTLFVLLFTVVESPLLLKETDKLVKKYVVDQTRKERMISLLDEGHKARKVFIKEDTKITKEFNKLYTSRESNENELTKLVDQYTQARNQMQEINLKVSVEAQEFIMENEWEQIQPGMIKGMKKVGKDLSKNKIKIEKSLRKDEKTFQKAIKDPAKLKNVVNASKEFENNLHAFLDNQIETINDENSVLYKLLVDAKDIVAIQTQQTQEIENLLMQYVSFHKVLVENTTEEEWKKIKGSIKFPV